jgi:hypothetical protein
MTLFTPNVTDLGRLITNGAVRKGIYLTYVVLLIVLGAFTIAYAYLNTGMPVWIGVANSVLAYLGIPVGGLAAANIVSSRTPAADAVPTVALSDHDRAILQGVTGSPMAAEPEQVEEVNSANLAVTDDTPAT